MEQPNNQFTQQGNQFTQPMQGQQPMMMQTPRKKPKKLGWIISLIILGLGLIGLAVGGMMVASNNPKAAIDSIDSGINDNPREALIGPYSGNEGTDSSKYNVKNGNGFLLIFINRDNADVPKIIVDGKEVGAFYTEKDTTIAGKHAAVKSYYYIVATSDTMSVNLSGPGADEGVHFLVGKGSLIEKIMPVMTAGLVVLGSLIFSGIALIVFIIFLVIFLMKNSAYKKQQTPSNFQY